MEYRYKALNAQGEMESDTIIAYDRGTAVKLIRDAGLFPTEIDVIGTGKKTEKTSKLFQLKRPMTDMEKVMICVISLLSIIVVSLLCK